MEIRQYTEFSEIPLDVTDWDRLVDGSSTGSVFLSYYWIKTWWNVFGYQYKLRFLLALENDQVIGFAPLMQDHRGCIRFIGDTNSDYLDFVVPSQKKVILGGFLKLLHDCRNDWSSIELKNIPSFSDILDMLPATCNQAGLIYWKNYSTEAPSLIVKGNERNTRKLLSKYSIRRGERQLSNIGHLEYRVIRNIDEADLMWDTFFNQHIRRCDSVRRKSNFLSMDYRRFIVDLFNSDVENNFTHFSVVLLNGKPIAFHFGLISQNRLLWYKPCFDPSFERCSPGILMIRLLIEYVLDNKLDEMDFTIGTEEFKDRFCSERRQVDTVRLYWSRFRYLYDYTHDILRRAAKKPLKRIRRQVEGVVS